MARVNQKAGLAQSVVYPDLKDKVVLVNGGASCIGAAIVRRFAQQRARVGRISAKLGPVQVLVNNAAHDERHATLDVTEAYWDGRIAVNRKHQFFAAQAVLPEMIAAGAGSIINFGPTSCLVG